MPWYLLGGALALVLLMRRRSEPTTTDDLVQLAVQTAQGAGVDPAVFLGIIQVESRWNPSATNLVGPDAARGGAYGLTQLTLKTARALEPSITPEQLLDPVTNLRVAGLLLKDNRRRGGALWPDVAAMWNSGRRFDAAPESTRYDYVPRVLAAANDYASDLSVDLGEDGLI
jgi:soluble lytic murein transglycosylase-like protein